MAAAFARFTTEAERPVERRTPTPPETEDPDITRLLTALRETEADAEALQERVRNSASRNLDRVREIHDRLRDVQRQIDTFDDLLREGEELQQEQIAQLIEESADFVAEVSNMTAGQNGGPLTQPTESTESAAPNSTINEETPAVHETIVEVATESNVAGQVNSAPEEADQAVQDNANSGHVDEEMRQVQIRRWEELRKRFQRRNT
jgi:hypothetical protein